MLSNSFVTDTSLGYSIVCDGWQPNPRMRIAQDAYFFRRCPLDIGLTLFQNKGTHLLCNFPNSYSCHLPVPLTFRCLLPLCADNYQSLIKALTVDDRKWRVGE